MIQRTEEVDGGVLTTGLQVRHLVMNLHGKDSMLIRLAD